MGQISPQGFSLLCTYRTTFAFKQCLLFTLFNLRIVFLELPVDLAQVPLLAGRVKCLFVNVI